LKERGRQMLANRTPERADQLFDDALKSHVKDPESRRD